MQEIDVYIVMPEATYLYEPKTHGIKLVADGSFGALTGMQELDQTF